MIIVRLLAIIKNFICNVNSMGCDSLRHSTTIIICFYIHVLVSLFIFLWMNFYQFYENIKQTLMDPASILMVKCTNTEWRSKILAEHAEEVKLEKCGL